MEKALRRPKRSKLARRSSLSLLLLGLPGIIFMLVFNYIPLYGVIIPFKNYKPLLGVFGSPWAGFNNFKFLFQNNQILRITFNTVFMNILFCLFNTIFGVLLALLLYEVSRRAVKSYQTIYFMPYFLSWAIVSLVVLGFLDTNGLVNKVLQALGMQTVDFYNSPKYWPSLLSGVEVWKMFGYASIIYYASLVGTDPTYFEAASIDGATKLQQIRRISLPILLPMIVMLNLMALGRVFFGDVGLFFNVTQNSTLLYPTTDVIDTYVLRTLKTLNDVGMSSAAGLYQSFCGLILVLTSNLIARKISPDNALF